MKILFMCVANSARSQIAEGLARHLFAELAEVESAGSAPSGVVHPHAVRVLSEINLDISRHTSKSIPDLAPLFVENLDYVISLCAEEVCPVDLTKATKLRWALPDPASSGTTEEERLEAFRRIRQELMTRLKDFRDEVLA